VVRTFHRGLPVLAALLVLQGCSLTHLADRLVPDARRPGRQPAVRRQVVYSEALPARGAGPVYVTLDSAAVYRVEPADGSVRVSPRLAHLPAPREVGSWHGEDALIAPRVTGEYRIVTEAEEEGVVEVRIWRDEGDQVERECVRRGRAPGCTGDAWAHDRTPLGFWLMFVAVPVGVAGMKWLHSNWR
jgi:hypothetical protein